MSNLEQKIRQIEERNKKVAFMLSILTMPFFKKLWLGHQKYRGCGNKYKRCHGA